jgi:hypothetical protein
MSRNASAFDGLRCIKARLLQVWLLYAAGSLTLLPNVGRSQVGHLVGRVHIISSKLLFDVSIVEGCL